MSGADKPEKKKRGRKTKWTCDNITAILAEMVEGKSLFVLCKEKGESYGSIWAAIQKDKKLIDMYARAKSDYAHSRVAQMDDIAANEPDVQRARLRVDVIKWEACKTLPKQYGDRQAFEHSGPDGKPLQPPTVVFERDPGKAD